MNIAIVGGTGFLGAAIARALVGQGANVVQIARGQMTQTPVTGAKFVAAERTDSTALAAIFAAHHIEAVIDVMTLTLASTKPLLEATARAGARYVMISAVDVYANYGGLARMENPAIISRPLREDDPVRKALFPYRTLPTKPAGIDPEILENYDKVPIEAAARANPSLILRLPAIYGPGDRQGRFAWLSAALRAGGPINIDARTADWAQSFVYIDDAAAAVARATLSGITGQTFNIATWRRRTMGEWAQHFAQITGSSAQVIPAPADAKALLFERAEMTDLAYPLVLDGGRFARQFGAVEQVEEAAAIGAARAWDDKVAADA